MPNLGMIVSELGNYKTCKVHIYRPVDVSTVLSVVENTARGMGVRSSPVRRPAENRISFRCLEDIIIAKGGSLYFDASEGYLSTFQGLQMFSRQRIVYGRDDLHSLFCYWSWIGNYFPIRLASISVQLGDDNEHDFYCQREITDQSKLHMTLWSTGVGAFLKW
jgi:hypothetical protein